MSTSGKSSRKSCRRAEAFGFAQQRGGEREAKGYGLARACLGGNEQIGCAIGFGNGLLDGGWLGIATRGEGAIKRGVNGWEGH